MSTSGIADVVVVIPAYRAASVVAAALASVAAQSVQPAEVVVVDDGSDDATADAARRFSSVLPLVVVSQSNAGPAAARRRAIAESEASLIALLDADDVWLPDHLAALLTTHQQRGGLITADAIPWRPGGALSLRATRRSQFAIPPGERQPLEILRDNFVFIGSLFSRACYTAAGGFRDGFTGAEDWDLWIRMIRSGTVVHGSPGSPTVLYRLVQGSLTRNASIYDRYLAVLDAARPGCRTDEERGVVDERLTWLRARKALALAYVEAERGSSAAARRLARGALHTSIRVTTQALGVMLAPRAAAALANRTKTRITR